MAKRCPACQSALTAEENSALNCPYCTEPLHFVEPIRLQTPPSPITATESSGISTGRILLTLFVILKLFCIFSKIFMGAKN